MKYFLKDEQINLIIKYLIKEQDENNMFSELLEIRTDLILVAQKVYDEWEQDNEGYDELYGIGGICDDIADAMCNLIHSKTDYNCFTFYNEFDCHTSIYVYDTEKKLLYNVDIPPYVYESGTAYAWKKLKDINFNVNHVTITQKDYNDYLDENDEIIDSF